MMKRSCGAGLAALLLLWAGNLSAQAGGAEKILDSKVTRVTAYSDRAMVERSATIEIPAGRSVIVFDALPEQVDRNSIQVRGQGSLVLEDIVFRAKYYSSIPDDRIKVLEGRRDAIQLRVQAAQDKESRAASGKAFLEKIVAKVTNATEQGASELNPERWIEMLGFYRDRLLGLDTELRAAQRERQAAQDELSAVLAELKTLTSGRQKQNFQAAVVLNADKAQAAMIEISYIVLGPSWRPVYDLRVDSNKKVIELVYSAYLTQNTGEDWRNVSLSLSTARPEIGGTQPELSPWFLRPANMTYLNAKQGAGAKSAASAPNAPMAQMFNQFEADRSSVSPPPPLELRGAEAQKGAVAVVFTIGGQSSIESDGAQHRVSIMSKPFPAAFRYSTVPKLSPYAYLKAKVKNESDYPFLPGTTKIFLDGGFVAESSMDLVANGEEFWTFLGVDESVKVEYKLLRKYKDESGILAKRNRYVYQYETSLTNNKAGDVELVLWDQLPVSADQKISVKLLEPKYQADSESLKKSDQDFFEWFMTLKSGETRKFAFSYSIEYPLDIAVEGLP